MDGSDNCLDETRGQRSICVPAPVSAVVSTDRECPLLVHQGRWRGEEGGGGGGEGWSVVWVDVDARTHPQDGR